MGPEIQESTVLIFIKALITNQKNLWDQNEGPEKPDFAVLLFGYGSKQYISYKIRNSKKYYDNFKTQNLDKNSLQFEYF